MDDYVCKDCSEMVDDMTALHLACLYNRPDVIELLLQDGAGSIQLSLAVPAITMLFCSRYNCH